MEDDVIGLCPHCGGYILWGRRDLDHEYRRGELAAACEGCAQDVDFVDSSPVPMALDRPRKGSLYD